MTSRTWSIRSKIVALVAVPVAALLALWILATALAVGPVTDLRAARTLRDDVARPGDVLLTEVQRERRLSMRFVAGGGDPGPLAGQRAATDRAAAEFRRLATGSRARDAAGGVLRVRVDQSLVAVDGLRGARAAVDRRSLGVVAVQDLYAAATDAVFKTFAATTVYADPQRDREARAVTTVARGREYLSRADALVVAGDAAGGLDARGRGALLAAISTSRYLFAEGVADLPADDRVRFQRAAAEPVLGRLRQLTDALLADTRVTGRLPVDTATWQPAYDAAAQELRIAGDRAAEGVADRAGPAGTAVLVRLAAAGLIGLVAVVASVVIAVRVGRSLIGRLTRLRGEALEVAGQRLPAVVHRLRRGEAVDVAAEAPPLEYGTDEIGQLGRAFTEVQRTAVRSAVDEATVRRGINEVFLNIARRSQSLLHRQLALLDAMERRTAEPEQLEDLYKVDHLATRLRRHAEDLVILAGAAPGRGWRKPVPVIDVVRGAISEVEDYKRIDIRGVEPAAIAGRAVGDVIHLLAELLENAASFSPPHTRVQVAGERVPNGYAVEIEDRGLGMTPEALDRANRRLSEPPDFDPADSARLGLFVVAQLAGRHHIRARLRPSAYGGLSAVVLIPAELVTDAPDRPAPPPERSSPPAVPDRPATGGDEPQRRALTAVPGPGQRRRPLTALPRRRGTGPDPAPSPAGDAAPARIPAQGPAPGDPAQRPATGPVAHPAAGDAAATRDLAAAAAPDARAAAPDAPAVAPDAPAAAPEAPAVVPAPRAPHPADGLPRRVRQASLAPQLRGPVAATADAVPARSPDEVRRLMSGLQSGTHRGRREAARLASDDLTTGPAAAAAVSYPAVTDAPDDTPGSAKGA